MLKDGHVNDTYIPQIFELLVFVSNPLLGLLFVLIQFKLSARNFRLFGFQSSFHFL